MNTLTDRSQGTSTGIRTRSATFHLVGAFLLTAGIGTGTSLSASIPKGIRQEATTIGIPLRETEAPDRRSSLAELRKRSGLTWEQLGKALGVSRRSVHFWISGSHITPENAARLRDTFTAFNRIDTGRPSENRVLMTTALEDGTTPLDHLADRDFAGFVAKVDRLKGRGPAPAIAFTKLPPAALGPEILVDARQGVAHKETGKRKVVKIKRRGLAA